MSKNETVAGIAAPLPLNNLDTDQIMPKQFLFGIDKSGLAHGVLYDLRMDAFGSPRQEFVLNRPQYQGARILVTGANFGCGSSREHAVWGLQQAGFDALIAPSFGEIFYFNALANRLLLVMLDPSTVATLMELVSDSATSHLTIDVQRQCVITVDGTEYPFELPARQKRMFVEGLDMIGMTLRDGAAIDAFEANHFAQSPWMKIDLPKQQHTA
ncbi:3-isopropylmalate dehydratase small subunit [Paraburkholderia ginsengiterrae]|uniref:3-isopropylmalate dehydratase small subunit n=1 Tax=Paraburkholderia ginsengiterrae TaxID=1462993 RepID=A0A1A9N063_9BURK|nr:3-isopropylmalate dehydratase small subunit [Paraburkholderia ginsengiterrae]OAJ52849.1 3-isopropylmalate dehydratase small subunit [Paraburkholderia ginsengiterrae]OAJ54142.1 3-isopropylmalate dehydratase small subunit [Paraburkholderia ginsengiterrae]